MATTTRPATQSDADARSARASAVEELRTLRAWRKAGTASAQDVTDALIFARHYREIARLCSSRGYTWTEAQAVIAARPWLSQLGAPVSVVRCSTDGGRTVPAGSILDTCVEGAS